MTAKLHFLGAAGCVTGSCMLLETDRARVLIDCGMFQGTKSLKELNYQPFPFPPGSLSAVLLTHAHIDHSGQLPKLVLNGYKGPIFATQGTADLCRVMLPDSGAIQEMEVEQLNRRRQRYGEPPVQPIYTRADAEDTMPHFRPVEFNTWTNVAPGVRARYWNAGHILGSASIEVEVGEGAELERFLFSGDVGPGGREFADDPAGPQGVDYLVVESTYGDTERPPMSLEQRRAALKKELLDAHALGGPLLVPAFAVERTQELIMDLLQAMEDGDAPRGPIFLDSPLAIRASETFLKATRPSDGTHPFSLLRESNWLRYTESPEESKAIERFKGWHVIVSASGMCDAGRVRHHLKRLLWRESATVMLIGYQAVGTLGRFLRDGAKRVRIQGEEFQVNARIRTLDIYSGHADAPTLERWVKARAPISESVFLTHGEPESASGLQKRLAALPEVNGRVIVPQLDQTFDVPLGAPAQPLAPAKPPRMQATEPGKLDWHNARAQLLAELDRTIAGAKSDRERESLLARVSQALKHSG
ncbi:MAG: MBL fold metallo-hydrolase [Terricaulis sp.]